ncbi:hypothetical protein QTP88_002145 [Uroleucon formosanum]
MEEICKTPALNTNIIDVQRIRKNIYETRKKILPANPNDLAGVHKSLDDMKPVTKEGFKMAIHKAVEVVWPNVEIVGNGCRFHLTQAWWQSVQQFGLSVDYKNMSSEIGQWIRHTFGLLFLDPHEVSECFVNDFISDCPDDERLKKYCDYLTDNFINEESLFPPQY